MYADLLCRNRENLLEHALQFLILHENREPVQLIAAPLEEEQLARTVFFEAQAKKIVQPRLRALKDGSAVCIFTRRMIQVRATPRVSSSRLHAP